MNETAEKYGAAFDPVRFRRVQAETKEALHRIAARIQPGMLEEEAYELAKEMLTEMGFGKSWHRPYVRFGVNTTLMYGKPSQPGVRLGADDLFYLDIGPVKDGLEGDAGDTFLTGSDPEKRKCVADTRALFRETREKWLKEKLTGIELYDFAKKRAEELGWRLNPDWDGHRISDFPHHAYFKGRLSEMAFSPRPELWILEIHLCDPAGRFGAFYEDVL